MFPRQAFPILRTVHSLRQWRNPHRSSPSTDHLVGLVPTMGALHKGHLSLIRLAAHQNHHVVVSIYVNPAQFGIKEDLSSYPKTWDADIAALEALDRELEREPAMGRVSAIFAPTTDEMYPEGFPGQEVDSKGSFVNITPLAEILEGRTRPTFFRGVATVCMKLFNAVQPETVYFGQKDAQQTVVIRRLVRDFLLPIKVVIGPTMRDEDGVAASSRNVYLGTRRRELARALSLALEAGSAQHASGETSRSKILAAANEVLDRLLQAEMSKEPSKRATFELDYLSLGDPDTMQEVEHVDPAKGAIISGAIKMPRVEEPQPGEDLGHSDGPPVRLIDNIILPRSGA